MVKREEAVVAVADHPDLQLALQGVDHLALVTDDMRKTIGFYTGVLSMRLVHVRRIPYAPDRGQPPYENCRHYFFDMGNQSLLAFFEYPPDAPRGNRDALGGMQHLAFHTNRENFERAQARLHAHGVKFVGPFHLGDRFYSIYFSDPNGIRLEITTDLTKPEYDVITSVYQTEAEARRELLDLYGPGEEAERVLRGMLLRDR